MPRILVLQHVAAEPLGTLDRLIRARGHRIRFVNFNREPDAQPNIDRYHGLIVLGGPMNVDEIARHPHLRTELHVIERALALEKPVLGICLGAQLLAHALGANVRRHREHEIGWYPLHLTDKGRQDAVLSPLGDNSHVFQWHGRTFELPAGARQLARTRSCEQQAFRWGHTAYGFQFHLEMDEALIERWLNTPGYRDELASVGIDQDAHSIRAAMPRLIAPMKQTAEEVFSRFLDLVGRPDKRITLPSR